MFDKQIRLLIIDDHAMVRAGLRLMLSCLDDMVVAGEAEGAADALALLEHDAFDVALLDINLRGTDGMDLLKQLRRSYPKMAVLMLSAYSEEFYAYRALTLGAAGYLNKSAGVDTVLGAVRQAASGGKYLSPATMDKLASMIGAPAAGHEALSPRELDVMRLIAAGESLVRIGELLQVSPSSITTYRARILVKMQLRSNTDIARYVYDHGLFR